MDEVQSTLQYMTASIQRWHCDTLPHSYEGVCIVPKGITGFFLYIITDEQYTEYSQHSPSVLGFSEEGLTCTPEQEHYAYGHHLSRVLRKKLRATVLIPRFLKAFHLSKASSQ